MKEFTVKLFGNYCPSKHFSDSSENFERNNETYFIQISFIFKGLIIDKHKINKRAMKALYCSTG